MRREKQYYRIERPRNEKRLPDVLSKEEVKRMLPVSVNKKHKCLIALIYSAGLRRSEAINLQPTDIDSDRMVIKIRGAKGKRDRYSQLSPAILNHSREYYKQYRPVTWLFEGTQGEQYSATSTANVVKQAASV